MSDSPTPATGRRLTEAARRKLNDLLAQGIPVAQATQQVTTDAGAFEQVPVAPLATTEPPPAPAPRPAWKGDATDWRSVQDKLARLRELDRGRAFCTDRHGYELAPPASERQVLAREKKLGVSLPPALRTFYTTVGNGGVGPPFGLDALDALKSHRPKTPYPGIAALRAEGAKKAPQPTFLTRANISPKRLTGAVTVIYSGCSLYSGVVCTGDVGRVVHLDGEGIVETDLTLVDLYAEWLDELLAPFELVHGLRAAGATYDEMERAMKKLLPPRDAKRARSRVDNALRGHLNQWPALAVGEVAEIKEPSARPGSGHLRSCAADKLRDQRPGVLFRSTLEVRIDERAWWLGHSNMELQRPTAVLRAHAALPPGVYRAQLTLCFAEVLTICSVEKIQPLAPR